MRKIPLLYLTIFIEGYAVLAAELLAIRQLIPFVGSGTEIIAIVISAVLLPLAIGYHAGGMAYGRHGHTISTFSARRRVIKNIITALVILGFGLSYIFMEFFFGSLRALGIHHRILQAALYVGLFLVIPVFLLGQTVPLISHYFSRKNLSEMTGRMLFFSTTGSFFGSIFSTLVLMSLLGVHITVILTLTLLALLVPMLSRRVVCYETVLAALMLLLVVAMNHPATMRTLGIVSNNSYNTVAIETVRGEPEARVLNINRSASAKISPHSKQHFAYRRYIEQQFLNPIARGDQPPRDVLMIGAGGFSIGLEDTHNHYTYVDIDPALKDISERYFLKKPLPANKHFVPISARAFLEEDTRRYDFILVDAFTNVYTIPMECTTREFLQRVKQHLKPDGVLVINIISSPSFTDLFTVRYHNTFASVFPVFNRQVLGRYNGWQQQPEDANTLYIYYHRNLVEDTTIYTDDKNTYSLDR